MLTKYIFIILIQLVSIQVGFGQNGELPKSPPTNKIQSDLISTKRVKAPNDFDKLIFEFKDSSVNPESQRNYKIGLTKTSAEIVLESYKVLDRKTLKIRDEQFNNIVKIVQNAQLKNRPNLDDDGCSGGATDIFEFFNNEKPTFKGFVYKCGGENFGDLVGNSDAVKNALTALFPTVKAKFRNTHQTAISQKESEDKTLNDSDSPKPSVEVKDFSNNLLKFIKGIKTQKDFSSESVEHQFGIKDFGFDEKTNQFFSKTEVKDYKYWSVNITNMDKYFSENDEKEYQLWFYFGYFQPVPEGQPSPTRPYPPPYISDETPSCKIDFPAFVEDLKKNSFRQVEMKEFNDVDDNPSKLDIFKRGEIKVRIYSQLIPSKKALNISPTVTPGKDRNPTVIDFKPDKKEISTCISMVKIGIAKSDKNQQKKTKVSKKYPKKNFTKLEVNQSSDLTSKEISYKIISLLQNLKETKNLAPANIEKTTGIKILTDKNAPNRFWSIGQIADAEFWKYRLMSLTNNRLEFTFYNTKDDKAEILPVCEIDYETYKNELINSGYSVNPTYGEHGRLLNWNFERFPTSVQISSYKYGEKECVKSIYMQVTD